MTQLCETQDRCVYIAFDNDENQAGQQAAHRMARLLEGAGLGVRIVQLPHRQDPNSYFAAGATATDFTVCFQRAQQL